MKISKKLLISLTITFIALALIIVGVYSFFSDMKTATTTANTGIVSFSIATAQNDSTGTVSIKNTSSIDTYARMKFKPFPNISVADESSSAQITNELDDSSLQYNLADDNKWILSDDGYYYYPEIIPAGTDINFNVKDLGIIDNTYDSTLFSVSCTLFSEVEMVQASNEAYKMSWHIDTIPTADSN